MDKDDVNDKESKEDEFIRCKFIQYKDHSLVNFYIFRDLLLTAIEYGARNHNDYK